MAPLIVFSQVVSITSALAGAGGIAGLTFFDVPILRAQPADRSLPSVRWLFSRGSHIFPASAIVSTVGFIYLAYAATPVGATLLHALRAPTVQGYLSAAALSYSIALVTRFIMLPNNFRLIELNRQLGGSRSVEAGKSGADVDAGMSKPSDLSRNSQMLSKGKGGKDEGKGVSELTDLSGPQQRTKTSSSAELDAEVDAALGKFARQNLLRAVLLGAGGVVGLVTALL